MPVKAQLIQYIQPLANAAHGPTNSPAYSTKEPEAGR